MNINQKKSIGIVQDDGVDMYFVGFSLKLKEIFRLELYIKGIFSQGEREGRIE